MVRELLHCSSGGTFRYLFKGELNREHLNISNTYISYMKYKTKDTHQENRTLNNKITNCLGTLLVAGSLLGSVSCSTTTDPNTGKRYYNIGDRKIEHEGFIFSTGDRYTPKERRSRSIRLD